jgi:hypothetical protein
MGPPRCAILRLRVRDSKQHRALLPGAQVATPEIEDPARPLRGFLEADETFIGGRGDPNSRGRSTKNPNKSLVVAAVEKVPAPKNKKSHAVKRPHVFLPAMPASLCCRPPTGRHSAPF